MKPLKNLCHGLYPQKHSGQGPCHGCHPTWDATGPPPWPGWILNSLYTDTLVAADSQPEAGELTKPGSCASISAAKEAGRTSTWHFQLLYMRVGEEEFPTVIGNMFGC